MAGAGVGGANRGCGSSWWRLWETAGAEVAVARGTNSGTRAARVCGCNLGSVVKWIWQLRAWAQQTVAVAQRDRRLGAQWSGREEDEVHEKALPSFIL